jgi:hypothetical protein
MMPQPMGQPSFSAAPPQPMGAGTNQMGIPDATDQDIHNYSKALGTPDLMQLPPDEMAMIANMALLFKRVDDVFRDVYKEYKIMNGNKKHDHLIWEAHHVFMQATDEDMEGEEPPTDPIDSNPDAKAELLDRLAKLMGGE